jgi:hypothetical protein
MRAMLAYVFWHSPAPGADRHGYERLLAYFHAALASDPPSGFAGSSAHAVDPVPWLEGDVYEDWYLVESWDDLGALNKAAVDAGRALAHDAAARAVAAGTAGVYRLRGGDASIPREGDAVWLHKPRGEAYPDVRARLAAAAESVWERQMVLGPAPEYCLFGAVGVDGIRARRRVVFP